MNYYPILFLQSGRAINLLTLLFSSSGHLRQNIPVLKNVKAIDCAGDGVVDRRRGCGGHSKRALWNTLCDVPAKGAKGWEVVLSSKSLAVNPPPLPKVLKKNIANTGDEGLSVDGQHKFANVALSSLPAAECFLSTVMYLGRKCQLNADKPIGATFQEAEIETVVNVA